MYVKAYVRFFYQKVSNISFLLLKIINFYIFLGIYTCVYEKNAVPLRLIYKSIVLRYKKD
jgi:hypothetical protein